MENQEEVLLSVPVYNVRTMYIARLLQSKEHGKSIEISKSTRLETGLLIARGKPIIRFSVKIWSALSEYPAEIIPFADSSSAYEGEIAYQMFAPKVYRRPYPAGVVAMTSACTVTDWKALRRKGLLQQAISMLLDDMWKVKESIHPPLKH